MNFLLRFKKISKFVDEIATVPVFYLQSRLNCDGMYEFLTWWQRYFIKKQIRLDLEDFEAMEKGE